MTETCFQSESKRSECDEINLLFHGMSTPSSISIAPVSLKSGRSYAGAFAWGFNYDHGLFFSTLLSTVIF